MKSKNAITYAVTAFVVIFLALVLVMVILGMSDTKVHVADNSLRIKGMYGLTVDFSEIDEIILIDKSMNEIGPGTRTNGFGGIGQALKGKFKSDGLGEILLFVQSKASPTIFIGRENGRDIYMSFRDGEAAKKLFNDLTAARNVT